jgi:Leishmanolysin
VSKFHFSDSNANICSCLQVKRFVRNFFACDGMPGAPLEDMDAATYGMHWDQRIFEV